MLFEEINPFVRQALGAQLTRHVKDTFKEIKTVDGRLFYISAGQGKMRFDCGTYDLQPGTIILFGANTPYTWEINSVNYYAINFDYTQNFSYIKRTFHPISTKQFLQSCVIESITFEDEPLLNSPLVLPCVPEFEKNVKRIVTEFLIGNEYAYVLTSALLKSLIVEVVRKKKMSVNNFHTKAIDIVQRIIEYIDNNYATEITYETLSKEFHFNPAYLNRIFKAYTKNSLHNFILQYRLNMAMEILSTQNLPVNQVASRCGFSNPYHFTKAFRKFSGVPPTEYKKQNGKQ